MWFDLLTAGPETISYGSMLRGCAKGRTAEACALSALQNGTASERAWSLKLIKPTEIQEITEQLGHGCTLWDNKQLRFVLYVSGSDLRSVGYQDTSEPLGLVSMGYQDTSEQLGLVSMGYQDTTEQLGLVSVW